VLTKNGVDAFTQELDYLQHF